MTHAVSPDGLALIQKHEGFRAEPTPLPDGAWLVGHGHVRVGMAGPAVSENEAAHLLALDLAPVERLVNATVTMPLTQSQFDALVSFVFSIGAEAFETSQVLRRVNNGDFLSAAYAMEAWRKSDVAGELVVVGALVRRRADEKARFLRDLPHEASPSAFVRARLDHAASVLGAPIKYAQAPTLGPIPVTTKPKSGPGARLVEILRSEPATETLLLTQVVIDEDEGEITTAHAKPVARPLDRAREAVRRAQAEQTAQRARFPLPWLRGNAPSFAMSKGVENFGLIALFLFGLALILAGGSMLMGADADAIQLLGAAAVTAPGLAASFIAGFGFLHGARAEPVSI